MIFSGKILMVVLVLIAGRINPGIGIVKVSGF
jgi:hypothetical protein